MGATNIMLKAGGTIRPARFIKLGPANHEASEADADEVTFGISMEGTQDAPVDGASGNAAEDGDNLQYHPMGDDALLELGVGGATVGARLKSDADGKGVVTTTDTDWFGAIAAEAGSAGEKIWVRVWGGFVAG